MADLASTRHKVATVGAAYSANKGAGSMIQALIDQLGDVTIDVHSTYAIADAHALRRYDNVNVVPAPPARTAMLDFPLAVVAACCRKLRIPWRWACRTAVLKSLRDSDVVADVTGISFSTDRPVAFAPYHFLLDAVPMLLGVPVVKCSQAIGPFTSVPVRWLSRAILPRLATVIARGPRTSALLSEASIDHEHAHDLAFVMELGEEHRFEAQRLLRDAGVRDPFIAVAPSTLVSQKSAASGLDYVGLLVELIETIQLRTDVTIVLIAHSSEPSSPPNHESVPDRLNDLVVCGELAAALGDRSGIVFLDDDLSPPLLRAVIELAEVLVTSRFHAMVSALSVGVPPVVIGWSHKYAEVLSAFDLPDAAIDYTTVEPAEIAESVLMQLEQTAVTSQTIADHIEEVRASAMTNLAALAKEYRR